VEEGKRNTGDEKEKERRNVQVREGGGRGGEDVCGKEDMKEAIKMTKRETIWDGSGSKM